MDIKGTIIVSEETKETAYKKIEERMKELELDYETKEREVKFTEIEVTLKLSKLRMIKHIFNIVKAPEEEIKYLIKIKSIVEATAKDILHQILQSIKG